MTSHKPATVELLPLAPQWQAPLRDFLRALEAAGDQHRFQPHPFTDAEVERLCSYQGRDVYRVLVRDGRILGYGLLRGWDEGYEVPSLGIAIRPDTRGDGLGRKLMGELHELARSRGATRVRLRVLDSNKPAIALYESLGYQFAAREGEYFVGFLELDPRP